MYEPVTITRSVEASPPPVLLAGWVGAFGALGAAARVVGASWAEAVAIRKGSPTPTARAERKVPSFLNTFRIISFSIGWVRFAALGLSEFKQADKHFFLFFENILNGARRVAVVGGGREAVREDDCSTGEEISFLRAPPNFCALDRASFSCALRTATVAGWPGRR